MNTKTKTKLTKNKYGRSDKFLLCFRPTVVAINVNNGGSVMPVRGGKDGSSEPVFSYVPMRDKPGAALPRVLPAVAASAVAASLSGDDYDDNNMKKENGVQMEKTKKKKKKKVGLQRLLGCIKAVLLESSVAKKIRKRRLQKKKSQPGETLNENSLHKEKELSEVDHGSILSNTSSSLKSSSIITSSSVCPSSVSSNSYYDTYKSFPSNTIERKQNQDNVRIQQHGKGCYRPNIGFRFMLIISLLVLVFWGKACAIFCTSTGLFFMPRWIICNNSSGNMATNSLRLNSDEYKKKIIMEGLLERNHFRGL